MRCFVRPFLLVAVVLLTSQPAANAENLLVNGNFEAGNTGFTSGYPYLQQTGGYQVVHNPHDDWFGGFFSFGDHTTGAGLMLAVDGATTPGIVVWQETVNASILQTYEFTGWGASMGQGQPGIDPNPALLNFYANDVLFGSFSVPATNGVWTPFRSTVNLLPGPVTLKIIDLTTAGFGNDFTLDDLSFAAVPEPSGIVLIGIGVLGLVCYGWRKAR
jgi:PEP-CTERM motif-containing protein